MPRADPEDMHCVARRAVILLLALAIPGAALAAAAGPSLKLVAPSRGYQGKPFTASVIAKGGSCALVVKYADGTTQQGLPPAQVKERRASWKWTVPQFTAPGPATLSARCGANKATRKITVVGSLIPPRIAVVKSGWSVRPRPTGDSVSYGVLLRNTSPNVDAVQVSVQVNFVLANTRLIGTTTQQIARIGAGETFSHAGQLWFPGAAPIAELEFVVIVGAREKAPRTPRPGIANVAWIPQTYEPAWLGWVQGEVVNDHPKMRLMNANLSAVLFDAAGKVLGGATGSAYNVLPPGTRQVFKLTTGVDAIAYERIASVAISTVPTWEPSVP